MAKLRSDFAPQIAWAIALTVLCAIGTLVPAWVFDQQQYLSAHLVLEFLSLAVSLMVFALAWNLQVMEANSRIYMLGLFALGIVLLDLLHTLSFAGMPDLVTPGSPQKSIFFWLIARFTAAVGFLLAFLVPSRHWSRRTWVLSLIAMVAFVAVTAWIGLLHLDATPTMFIPGEGLTRLKINAEYVIAGLHAGAALLFSLRARKDRDRNIAWLATAIWTLMLAEMFFTLYANVTDIFNLLGHIYKVSAYLMIYRAIFAAGVREPYLRLDREQSLLRSLIDSVPDLISFKDQRGTYLGANAAWSSFTGLRPAEFIGQGEQEVLAQVDVRVAERRTIAAGSGGPEHYEEHVAVAGEQAAVFDTLLVPYIGPDNTRLGTIEVRRDISAQKVAEDRIHHLALYDQVTGLPNRANLAVTVDAAMRGLGREFQEAALLYLDLDDFRTINDTLGHRVGDLVLKETASRALAVGAEADVVSRLGGDEFALLIRGGVSEATAIATRLRETIAQPMHLEEHELSIEASIGIAIAPNDGTDFESLFTSADAAMMRAKSDGDTAIRFYTSDMQEQAALRLQLTAALRRAVENQELELRYQPQVSAIDGSIKGVEALVRWHHPELGLLEPEAFISLAEDSGMIIPIGDWVLRQALADANHWVAQGAAPLVMAVNISAVQFRQSDLPTRIARALEAAQYPAHRLDIEITETVAMHNPEVAEATVRQLHEIGVLFSIDDFGTGYSSLSYLKRFRVNRLKIDRSFVHDLGGNAENAAIVTAIIQVARALQCQTIAEGVETRPQADHLRSLNCELMQGYLFSRPITSDETLRLLLAPALPWQGH